MGINKCNKSLEVKVIIYKPKVKFKKNNYNWKSPAVSCRMSRTKWILYIISRFTGVSKQSELVALVYKLAILFLKKSFEKVCWRKSHTGDTNGAQLSLPFHFPAVLFTLQGQWPLSNELIFMFSPGVCLSAQWPDCNPLLTRVCHTHWALIAVIILCITPCNVTSLADWTTYMLLNADPGHTIKKNHLLCPEDYWRFTDSLNGNFLFLKGWFTQITKRILSP